MTVIPNHEKVTYLRSQCYTKGLKRKLDEALKLFPTDASHFHSLYESLLSSTNPCTFDGQILKTHCVVMTNSVIDERIDKLIIFLHGLGAAPLNFVRIAQIFFELDNETENLSAKVAVIFPYGFLKMEENEFGALPGSIVGCYKWWDVFGYKATEHSNSSQTTKPLRLRSLTTNNGGAVTNRRSIGTAPSSADSQSSMNQKKSYSNDFSAYDDPYGRQEACDKICDFIKELINRSHIHPSKQLVISGFSQGAMLALDVTFSLGIAPNVVALLSAAPMCIDRWKKLIRANSALQTRTKFVQTHGKVDWIFPIFIGRWLYRFLTNQGLQVFYSEFEGEHEFTTHVVQELAKFILLGENESDLTRHKYYDSNINVTLMRNVDDIFYNVGYMFANCMLPVIKKINH